MKILKFGNITMPGADLNVSGFIFDGEGKSYNLNERNIAAMEAIIDFLVVERRLMPPPIDWNIEATFTDSDNSFCSAIVPPVAAGSVDRPKLHDMTLADTETRDWYFDCDGHYIDVELWKDGHYSIYFRNRAEGGKGWLDTGVLIERAEKAEARVKYLEESIKCLGATILPNGVMIGADKTIYCPGMTVTPNHR